MDSSVNKLLPYMLKIVLVCIAKPNKLFTYIVQDQYIHILQWFTDMFL